MRKTIHNLPDFMLNTCISFLLTVYTLWKSGIVPLICEIRHKNIYLKHILLCFSGVFVHGMYIYEWGWSEINVGYLPISLCSLDFKRFTIVIR